LSLCYPSGHVFSALSSLFSRGLSSFSYSSGTRMVGTSQGVSMNKVFRWLTAAALAVVSLSGVAIAQTAASGNIEGVVTDTTGAVLPGVTVVVKNTATNVTRELVTDGAGRYRANALQ